MFHELTYAEIAQRKQRRMATLAAIALCLALVAAELAHARTLQREQGATSLRQAVIDAALQCRAVEGSYPSTLDHLEQHYGLVINKRDYLVSYEWLGDNVAPSVVVRPL